MKELEKDMSLIRVGMKECEREMEFYRGQPVSNGDRLLLQQKTTIKSLHLYIMKIPPCNERIFDNGSCETGRIGRSFC